MGMRKRKATNRSARHRSAAVVKTDEGDADTDPALRGFLTSTIPFTRPAVTAGLSFGLAIGIDLVSKVLAVAFDAGGHVVVYNPRPGALVQRILMTIVALVTATPTNANAVIVVGRPSACPSACERWLRA